MNVLLNHVTEDCVRGVLQNEFGMDELHELVKVVGFPSGKFTTRNQRIFGLEIAEYAFRRDKVADLIRGIVLVNPDVYLSGLGLPFTSTFSTMKSQLVAMFRDARQEQVENIVAELELDAPHGLPQLLDICLQTNRFEQFLYVAAGYLTVTNDDLYGDLYSLSFLLDSGETQRVACDNSKTMALSLLDTLKNAKDLYDRVDAIQDALEFILNHWQA